MPTYTAACPGCGCSFQCYSTCGCGALPVNFMGWPSSFIINLSGVTTVTDGDCSPFSSPIELVRYYTGAPAGTSCGIIRYQCGSHDSGGLPIWADPSCITVSSSTWEQRTNFDMFINLANVGVPAVCHVTINFDASHQNTRASDGLVTTAVDTIVNRVSLGDLTAYCGTGIPFNITNAINAASPVFSYTGGIGSAAVCQLRTGGATVSFEAEL